jgi:WD40 repeat protein
MDSQVILWDTQTGNLQRRLDQAGGMARPHFSPDGAFLLGGRLTGVTSLLQVETGEVIRRYDGFAQSLSFSSDGKHAVIGLRSGGVELWRIDSTLDELLTWTRNNRYLPELTCEQREYYNVEPLCEMEP